jgi:cell division protein FtsB
MEKRIAELEAKNAELTQRVTELETELYSDMPHLIEDDGAMQISELA